MSLATRAIVALTRASQRCFAGPSPRRGFCQPAREGTSEASSAHAPAVLVPWTLALAGMVPFAALTPLGVEALGSVPELKQAVPGFTCLLARATELQKTYAACIIRYALPSSRGSQPRARVRSRLSACANERKLTFP